MVETDFRERANEDDTEGGFLDFFWFEFESSVTISYRIVLHGIVPYSIASYCIVLYHIIFELI